MGALSCFLMSANVSGPCISLWALEVHLSGSQLSNGSASALNIDVNMQPEEQWVMLRQSR